MKIILNKKCNLQTLTEIMNTLTDAGAKPIFNRSKNSEVSIIIRNPIQNHINPILNKYSQFIETSDIKNMQVENHNNDLGSSSGHICNSFKLPILIAGPCAVESENQIHTIAKSVKSAGAQILRGGVFKPRTSPYSFQGLGYEGLGFLSSVARENNLKCVTEVTCLLQIEKVVEHVDFLQVGARNMFNYELLKELGKIAKPIILKRNQAATVKELIYSAEYIYDSGNSDIIFCERGIRSFETMTRNTLDISAIPLLKQMTDLPLIVDPSHAAGRTDIIESLSLASIAAGADGIMLEVHHQPQDALCDGKQSITPQQLKEIAKKILQ